MHGDEKWFVGSSASKVAFSSDGPDGFAGGSDDCIVDDVDDGEALGA